MPALPTITDVYRVAFNWTTAGAPPAVNVMHFRTTGTVAQLGTALDTILNTAGMDQNCFWPVAPAYSVHTLDILPLDGSSATSTKTLASDFLGGTSGSPMPQVAGVVTLQTGLRGPQNRGRIFLGPAGEDAQAAGVLTPAGRTAMIGGWAAFLAALAAASPQIELGVASYAHSTFHEVSSIRVNSYMGTQRRRARYLQ